MTTIFQLLSTFRYVSRNVQHRLLASYIPKGPVWSDIDTSKLPPETKVDEVTISHLEHQALVDFSNQEAIRRLEKAIQFADQLSLINTNGVEPMDTVLENVSLYLRDDCVTDGNCRDKVMKNATITEDEYFVAPPGNIPLEKGALNSVKDKDK